MKRLLLAASALAATALAIPAVAAPVTISAGACVPGSATVLCSPSLLSSGPGGIFSLGSTSVGAFTISGSAESGTTLNSAFFNTQTLQLSSSSGGLLNIYFAVSNVPTQQIPLTFTSTFTSNQQNADVHQVIEGTYLNNDNATFGTEKQLATATLTNAVLQTAGPDFLTTTPSGTVSLVHTYQIELTGCADQPSGSCTGNLTIDLSASAVPEPGSIALLGVGLLGLGFLARRKKGTVA